MDISQLRADTRGTQNVIHFNNAGAALMPNPVSKSVKAYLDEERAYGGYETAQKYQNELEQIYPNIAALIHADPDEIAIQENATMAWNMAFLSINFKDGDRILISRSEYASNYIDYLKLKQNVDVNIEVIPNNKQGQTSVRALSNMMDRHVKLISITHIPTNSGLVNPAEQVGQVANEYNCLYLLDACQSVGQYPVNVQKIGCHMLSATGRKFLRGPRGTGFLYVDKDILQDLRPPILDLHSAEWIDQHSFRMRNDARRFENWEFNYAAVRGLSKAVSYAYNIGIQNIWERLILLGRTLREKLSNIEGITVRDIGFVQGAIVSFTVDGFSARELKEILAKHHINVSVSGKSSTLLDMQQRNLDEVVRASVHYYNTENEINQLIEVLNSLRS